MKSQEAVQAALFTSPYLAEVLLVKLTTYTDRTAQTVDAVRYLSTATRFYSYDGAPREFAPWVVAFVQQRDTMDHVPRQDGAGLESTLRRIRRLRPRNRLPEDGGTYLFAVLRAEALEYASVEVATLALNAPAQGWHDLSSFAGTEHTVVYRGRVANVRAVDDAEFELELESELPAIPWLYATDPTENAPRDVGMRLPIPLGRAKRVPLIGWDVGAATTLAVDATWNQTTLTLTDASSFPSSGQVKLGTEDVLYSGKSGNDLTGCTRNHNGTRKQAHKAGAFVLEIQTSATWVSGIPASALAALYVVSPINGELVRIPSGFSQNLADAATIPGSTVASVTFTQAQLATLLASVHAAAEVSLQTGVTQQPIVSHPVGGSVLPIQAAISGHINLRDGSSATGQSVNGETMGFQAPSGTFASQEILINTDSPVGGNLNIYAGSAFGPLIGQILDSSPAGAYIINTINSTNSFYLLPGVGASCFVREFRRQVTIDSPAPTLSANAAVRELELAGFSVGFGIRFFADLDGPVASGGVYSVSNGTLLEKMPDLIRYVLADLCGLGHSAIDASFATVAGATYLDDNAHAIDLRLLGERTLDVLARLAFEGRCNLVTDERASGTVYRLAAALATYGWPAAAVTLDSWEAVVEEGRNTRALATRFRALYLLDPSLGVGVEAFRSVIATTVAAVEAQFGRIDHPVYGLASVVADATAAEVAGYYAAELSRVASVYAVRGVPWSDGYVLERGDVIGLVVPWAGGTVKCRVIETDRRSDGKVDLKAVSVP